MLLRSAVCPGGTGRASSGTTLGTVSAAGASESGDGPWGFLDLCGDMGGGRTRDVRAFPTWSGTTLQGSAATNGSASRQRPGHRAATSHSFRVTTRSLYRLNLREDSKVRASVTSQRLAVGPKVQQGG